MANDAQVTMQVTVLPDEIAKTFSASMTVTPADDSEKWYYKKTSVSNTGSEDLIEGHYIDYTAIDNDTAPGTVHDDDEVKFLFIKNIDTNSRSITFAARLPNTTVSNLHCKSSASTAECIVCALLHDVVV